MVRCWTCSTEVSSTAFTCPACSTVEKQLEKRLGSSLSSFYRVATPPELAGPTGGGRLKKLAKECDHANRKFALARAASQLGGRDFMVHVYDAIRDVEKVKKRVHDLQLNSNALDEAA